LPVSSQQRRPPLRGVGIPSVQAAFLDSATLSHQAASLFGAEAAEKAAECVASVRAHSTHPLALVRAVSTCLPSTCTSACPCTHRAEPWPAHGRASGRPRPPRRLRERGARRACCTDRPRWRLGRCRARWTWSAACRRSRRASRARRAGGGTMPGCTTPSAAAGWQWVRRLHGTQRRRPSDGRRAAADPL